MIEIEYSPRFERDYKKLPERVKDLAAKKVEIFRANPFARELRTHKLSGWLRNYWAFRIDLKYRIIFSFLEENKVRFHTIGTHSIYT